MAPLTQFLWGVFPYICLVVMIVGTLYRYSSNQLSWTSKSSEIFEKRLLRIGSMLFHWGILFVLGGHIMGVLVPMSFYDALGISPELYHTFAEIAGGFFGLVTLVGISLLLYRRIFNARVRKHSDFSDYLSDGLLWIVIALGEAMTLGYSLVHGTYYEYRATVGPWIWSILTLHPNITLMVGIPLLLQVHIALAFLLFGISPFTRLIHIYSFPLGYLTRAPLQYRARRGYSQMVRQPRHPVPTPPSTLLTLPSSYEEPVTEPERELTGTASGARTLSYDHTLPR